MADWFTRWFKKQPAKVHTIQPQVTLADVVTPQLVVPATHVILKRLKWVVYSGKIGIVYELDTSGYAKIHLVSPTTGETVDMIRVRCSELRLAKYLEIPECRRQRMSSVVAAALGYM